MHDPQGLGPAATAALIEVAARLLVQELDGPAIDALRHEDLLPLLEQLEPGVSAHLDVHGDTERLERLAAEFCRLFLMSKATSPMLSVWLPGDQLQNAAQLTARVEDWQSHLGVEFAEGPWGNLPRDHAAVALGLYSLALHADDELAEEIAASVLRPAIPRFARAVCEHSSDPIYRAGVRLLSSLIE